MATVEKVLAQISERKKSIIEHVRHQIRLFDHHLASNCLLAGVNPPPWLLPDVPSEFKKEDVISGLLFSHPQLSVPCSSSHLGLYEQHVVRPDNLQFSDVLVREVHPLEKGFDLETGPSGVQCHESGKYASEISVATPADVKDPTTSDANPYPVLSRERLQRSRSRQKYLELRNSAKATKCNSNDAKDVDSCDPNSGGPLQQPSREAAGGSEIGKFTDNILTFEGEEEKVGKRSIQKSYDNVLSDRVTRFRSPGQQTSYAIEPASGNNLSEHEDNGAVILTESVPRVKNADSCDAGSLGPEIASLKSGRVAESVQVKSAEYIQVDKQLSLESCDDGYSGVSNSCRRHINSVNEPTSVDNHSKLGKEDDVICTSSLIKSRIVDCCDAGAVIPCIGSLQTNEVDVSGQVKSACNVIMSEREDQKIGKHTNKGSCENMYSGIVVSPRSSRWQNSNELPSTNEYFDIAKKNVVMSPGSLDKSRQEPTIAVQFFESEQISLSDKEIEEIGAREVNKESSQSDEKRSSHGCLRVTRSKDSSLQNASLNRHHNMGPDDSKQSCDGKSMLLPNHVDSLEPVKIFGVNERGVTDCQLLVNLMDQYINENSGTESTFGVAGSLRHSSPSNDPKHEVMQSKYNSSSKSSHEISLKSSAGIGDQEASGAQENVLPNTSGNIVGPNGQDGIVMDTGADFNELVNLHSGSLQPLRDAIDQPSVVKSLDRISGVLLQDVGSSPQCNSAMVVEPRQLDFKDVEERNVSEASSFSLDKKKEIKLHSAENSDKISPFGYQEKPNSLVKRQSLAGKEVKAWEDLMVTAPEETCQTSRTSNINTLPSGKERFMTHLDTSLAALEESSGIPKQRIPLADCSPENILGKPTKAVVASDLSAMSASAGIDSPHEGSGQFLKLKLPKLNPDESTLEAKSCGGPEESAESDFIGVDGSDLLEKVDLTPADCDVDSSLMISLDGAKVNSGEQQKENLCTVSHDAGSCSEGRCDQNEDNVILPSVRATFHENHMGQKHLQSDGNSSYSSELSWPQKRRKINGQGIVLSTSLGSKDKHSLKRHGNKSPPDGEHQNMDFCVTDTPTSYQQLQVDAGLFRLKDKQRCRNTSSVSVSSVAKETLEDSKNSLGGQKGVIDQAILISDSQRECKAEENQISLQFTDKFEQQNDLIVCNEETAGSQIHWVEASEFSAGPSCKQSMQLVSADLARPEMDLMVFEKTTGGSTVHCMENCKLSTIDPHCSLSVQLVDADQVRPEMEGFVLQTDYEQSHIGDGFSLCDYELPKTAVEHASLLKELCKSSHVDTPLSQFPTISRLQKTPNLFQSVPNGLLECLDTGLSFHANDYITKQLKLSTGWFGEEIGNTLHPRSFSDCCPAPSSQLSWDQKKPCASPVKKIWDTFPLNSSSSGKRSSRKKPELPCISEENEAADEVFDATKRGIDFEGVTCSARRKPLAEVKEDQNVLPSVSEAKTLNCRNSLDSIDTAYSFCVTKDEVKQKVEHQNTAKRRDQNKLKENQNLRQGANKRASKSVTRKLSKPNLSGKTSSTGGGLRFSGKEAKVKNIVSNVTSFVPLVQQKPTAPVIAGKKDVKVKALEAAEAAKRLAEKKQNERNMKKEALKLERARLEQENLKQLELQKKQKEEEQKKKEACMAAKKRQREEEERLEKERKRKRIEEAWKQQREIEDKLHTKKDEKEKNHQAPDERVNKKKVPNGGKDKRMVKDTRDCNVEEIPENKLRTSTASANASLSLVLDDHNSKVHSERGKTSEDQGLVADAICEQSYDISPYKGSDDESEEEDSTENTKFVPSWARKGCVALAVASQQNQDPEVIFPLTRSYSTSEVTLPRRLQLR